MKQEQPAKYLFDDAGLAALRSFMDARTLFAFDLDGTLAPIVNDPSAIEIPGDIRENLIRLNAGANVAVLTGRARDNARSFLGFEPRIVIGNHGLEGLPGWEGREKEFRDTCAGWKEQLGLKLPHISSGIVLEDKQYSLSLHYRNAPRREQAFSAIMDAIWSLAPAPERVSGKFVENIIPQGAPRKGRALVEIMRHLGAVRAVFVGDDETDEDVFRLRHERIFGIRVGREQTSVAAYFLENQRDVARLLEVIIDAIQYIRTKPHGC